MFRSGHAQLIVTVAVMVALFYLFGRDPAAESVETKSVESPRAEDRAQDARDIRTNLLNSSDHKARLRMLELLKDLDPSEPNIEQQIANETAAVNKQEAAYWATKNRITGMTISRFCAELRRHPTDVAVIAEFEHRAGSSQNLTRVIQRNLVMGMNEFEVRCAWGDPEHIRTTVIGNDIEDKQLVYSDSTYVYLHNGMMTAMQR
jgi:hypothetical protein